MVRHRKVLIAIPTYWTFGRGSEVLRKSYEIYDHPTEIPRYETLSRLLDSMGKLDCAGLDVRIAVLAASADGRKKYEGIIERLLKKAKAKIAKEPILLFQSSMGPVKGKLAAGGYPGIAEKASLVGYPNVRNMGLLLGRMLECDAVYFLDDDEVVTDEGLLKKLIGAAEENGTDIMGGTYYSRTEEPTVRRVPLWRRLWNKRKYVEMGKKEKRCDQELNLILGGNALISRKALEKVPFDPWILRGEDFDYSINAKHFGLDTRINEGARILHLPPVDEKLYLSTYWSKLRADVYRFFYTKEKMDYMGLSLSMLPPYPRVFMEDRLTLRAVFTAWWLAVYSLGRLDLRSVKENLINVKRFLWDCGRYAKRHKTDYAEFQKEWEGLMADQDLQKELAQALDLR